MKTVGITGGIGAGKSIVCQFFQILGVPVYDADSRAKRLMNENQEVKFAVQRIFGEKSYLDEKLDRNYIGKLAFHNPNLLKQLNAVVHPAVALDFQKWRDNQHAEYVLKEAALLVENGSYKMMDHLIVVLASAEIRIARVLKRDPHRNIEDIKAILNRQASEQEKREVADSIIINDSSRLLIPQILKLDQYLRD